MDRGDAERLFQLLASELALGERFERNALGFTNAYVTVGPRARAVLEGKLKLEMGVAAITSKKTSAKSTSTTAETSFFDDDDGVEEDEDDVPLAQLAWNPMARKASTSTAAGKKRVAPVQAKPPPAADATSALFAELMAIRDQVRGEFVSPLHSQTLTMLPTCSPRSRKIASPKPSSRTSLYRYGQPLRRCSIACHARSDLLLPRLPAHCRTSPGFLCIVLRVSRVSHLTRLALTYLLFLQHRRM